jgi:DNA repair protein RecN (Recombination protein N)
LLERLRIQNLAVVEDVTLEFDAGLNVLTGSTGAGKSLILGAVNLLMGRKASTGAIRTGEDSASVEGVFVSAASPGVPGGKVTIKREIHRNGRSRAFVDGSPVTAKQLNEASARWIEPHGQNEQFRLKNAEAHAGFLDAFADSRKLVEAYRGSLDEFRRAERQLRDFDERIAAIKEKRELLEHRMSEVDRAAISFGEMEELERTIQLMENAERLYETLGFVYDALDGEESGTLPRLAQAARRLSGLAGLDDRLQGYLGQLQEAEITLRDCADSVSSYMDAFEFDPERLRALQDRRAYLLELERRYGMPPDEIVRMRGEWASELDSVEVEEQGRRELSVRVGESRRALQRAADRLRETRKRGAAKLDRRMTAELEALMITGARFRTDIALEPASDGPLEIDGVSAAALPDGADVVRFMVRTNPGEMEGPVDEIASTGEISRISLALRNVIQSESRTDPSGSVLVFDEVDAGVGADLGGVIAEKLLELGKNYQIICITHMPQIAAAGKRHLVVSKRNVGGRTFTTVARVDGDDRTREIARMLGGERGSDKRIALAGELLGGVRGGEKRRKEKRP